MNEDYINLNEFTYTFSQAAYLVVTQKINGSFLSGQGHFPDTAKNSGYNSGWWIIIELSGVGQIGENYLATWQHDAESHTYSYLVSKGDTITLRYNTGFDPNYFYSYKPTIEDIERWD